MINYLTHTRFFVNELIRMIDEGQEIGVREINIHIEAGDVCEFIQHKCGYKDININKTLMKDVDNMLQTKYSYLSESEAQKLKVNKNGLLLLVRVFIDDYMEHLYDLDFNA